jgi:hypothetical protein
MMLEYLMSRPERHLFAAKAEDFVQFSCQDPFLHFKTSAGMLSFPGALKVHVVMESRVGYGFSSTGEHWMTFSASSETKFFQAYNSGECSTLHSVFVIGSLVVIAGSPP